MPGAHALEDDSQTPPAHYGHVGGQASSRMLLWARVISYQDFHGHGSFFTPTGGDIPQASLWQPLLSGCPVLSVPSWLTTVGLSSLLRELSLFPASFWCLSSCSILPLLREGKLLGRPQGKSYSILQGSMGFDGAWIISDFCQWAQSTMFNKDMVLLVSAAWLCGAASPVFVWAEGRSEAVVSFFFLSFLFSSLLPFASFFIF